MENHNSGVLEVSGEFQRLRETREKQAEELARAFVEGGRWLASQNDPVRQFEDIVKTASHINTAKRDEARQQFQEIVNLGHIDTARAFDLMCGLAVFRINPQSFYRALIRGQLEELLREKVFGKRIEYDFKENFIEWKPIKEFLNENYIKAIPYKKIYEKNERELIKIPNFYNELNLSEKKNLVRGKDKQPLHPLRGPDSQKP